MNTSIASEKKTGSRADEYRKETIRKALLFCGIISSLWYVAVNIIVPMQYPGYSIASQVVSELSAIDAPTRSLWILLCIPYSLLVIAFAWGIWLSAGENRLLRIVAALFIINGVIGFFWPPMHRREVLAAGEASLSDTLHIAFTAVWGILMMLAIGLGAAVLGKGFRFYSIVTLIVMIGFGVLTGKDASLLQANLPTPWMGVWERVNIYVTMLWILVFAIILRKKERKVVSR